MRRLVALMLLLLSGCVTTGDGGADPTTGRGRWASDPTFLTKPTVVSVEWLDAQRGRLVVFDTRPSAEVYAEGAIPGALHLPTSRLRRTLPDGTSRILPPEELVALFSDLGVGDGVGVVAYGDDRLQDACHVVVALLTIGHPMAAVLEGGLTAWRESGRPLVADVLTPTPKFLSLAPSLVRTASTEEVALGAMPIVDSRPEDQFLGAAKPGEPAGRIPGSCSRPLADDLVKDAGGLWWKSRAELEAAYAALDVRDAAIATCKGGLQATQTWFTLSVLLGRRDVRWYDGSFLAWAADPSRPRETGPASRPAPPPEPPANPPIVDRPTPPTPVAPPTPAEPTPAAAAPRGTYATDPERLEQPTVVSTGYVAGGARGAVILDTRPRADYLKGHVAGARHLDPDASLTTTRGSSARLLLSPRALAVVFGQLGIDEETPVVCLGEALDTACLAAAALQAAGHRRVAVMEGGLDAWRAEKRPLTQAVPRVEPTVYKVRTPTPRPTADLADVAGLVDAKSRGLVDVRDAEAFAGDAAATGTGHLPRARHLPAARFVTLDGGMWWVPKENLLRDVEKAEIVLSDAAVIYSRHPREAAFAWFTLTVLGGSASMRWYDGGFAEWSQDPRRPLETGPSR